MLIVVLSTDTRCALTVFTFCYVIYAVSGVTTTKTRLTKTNLKQYSFCYVMYYDCTCWTSDGWCLPVTFYQQADV